jgi:hypothetical protein
MKFFLVYFFNKRFKAKTIENKWPWKEVENDRIKSKEISKWIKFNSGSRINFKRIIKRATLKSNNNNRIIEYNK